MNILQSIGAGIASIGLFIGSLFGYAPAQAPDIEELGRAVNPVATNNYVIAGSGISSSATTITLSSFTAPVSGVKYSMANFGDGVNAKGYLTIEPGSKTRQEIVSFTGITQNADGSATLTGVTRGLLPFSPFSASSTYATAHNGGAQVTVSNPPQLYDAIYSYIDNATTSGAIDATTLAKGIVEVATGIEAASTTQIGGGNTTAPLVLTTLISTSTGGGAYVIPVSKSSGAFDRAFMFGSSTVQTYTSVGTTTWTKPAGLMMIRVQAWGGGGSGARGDTAGDEVSGGGGGGYCEDWFPAGSLSSTETVVVGAGGAAQTSDSNGVTGSTTTFGLTKIVAYGGGGGVQSGTGAGGGGGGGCFRSGGTPSGVIGGVAADLLSTDGNGTSTAIVPIAIGGAGACTVLNSGNECTGGRAVWGGAGGGGTLTSAGAGATSTSLYGGDGGSPQADTGVAGAGEQPSGGGGAGFGVNSGKGGDGKIVITEYY